MSNPEKPGCEDCPRRQLLITDLGNFSTKIASIWDHPLLSSERRKQLMEAEDLCNDGIAAAQQLCGLVDECAQPEDLSYFDPANTTIRSHVATEQVRHGARSRLSTHPHLLNTTYMKHK